MKKWLTILILMIITVQLVTAVCCEKNSDCIVTETCQDTSCGFCTIRVYNIDGTLNMTQQNMTQVSDVSYKINLSTNLSGYGTYPYVINCSTNKTCEGDCQVEIHDYCGRNTEMSTGIVLFLLLFNTGIFIVPLMVKQFHNHEAANYIIKRMILLAGIVVLWFNVGIFRTLAISYNLGIDNFLKAYWWIFTVIMFAVIFLSIYFTTMGALRLIREAKLRKRLGYDEEQ